MSGQEPTRSRANTFGNRVRYRFDNLLARGTWAVLLWLGVITLAAVLLSSLILVGLQGTLDGSQDKSWAEGFWQSLMRAMDPGTMADDVGAGERLAALLVTVVGILIAGTLIGLIANGIEQRLKRMQRGRSVVVESGHVVILGDSTRLPVIVEQLTMANVSRKNKAIVVLAEREPAELSEKVRSVVTDTRGSRLVFRWGDPTRPADLAIAATAQARAVIVVGDEESTRDAGAVKAVLAVGSQLGGFGGVPIVVAMSDPAAAAVLVEACGDSVFPVVASQAMARTTLFSLRQSGLNQVVEELVDYRGADIYVRERPDVVGLSFAEILVRFSNARPIGRMVPGGSIELNPPPETVFGENDRLIVIADDERPLELASSGSVALTATTPSQPIAFGGGTSDEHFLVIGWNALGAQLVSQWTQLATPGSTFEIAFDERLVSPELDDDGLDVTLMPNRKSVWLLRDMASTDHLTTIVLLGYRTGMTSEGADSRTLVNLMLLQKELEQWPGPHPRVLVEVVDAHNVALARTTGADDFLVSDAIGSRLMVQVAEEPNRRSVLLELYDPDGPSIHLVPAERLGLGGETSAAEVFAAASAAGVIGIGWRDATERGGKATLNPKAGETVRLQHGDQIVVIG